MGAISHVKSLCPLEASGGYQSCEITMSLGSKWGAIIHVKSLCPLEASEWGAISHVNSICPLEASELGLSVM
ncbi:hypothetical protein DPMN_000862 [Dreissena polymorpha]|uniref:Uncharacterized protein n=1 Tax=Dreissena polymorpha TaxID=45954 RepID=A0A9D4MHG4_DREPO|nr:hypothetical protein DPMN_000862 [Dreissena polymorpha]